MLFDLVIEFVLSFHPHSNMYIHVEGLSDALHRYFLHRSRNSVMFSLRVKDFKCLIFVYLGCVLRCVGCLAQMAKLVGYLRMKELGLRFYYIYLKQSK